MARDPFSDLDSSVEGIPDGAWSRGDAAPSALWVMDAGSGDDTLAVPRTDLLLLGQYQRDGSDLLIEGADGATVLVRDYFVTGTPPDLVGPGGETISGDLASRLAGPRAPGQIAQAGTPGGADVIGSVTKAEGTVTLVRADGTRVQAAEGDPVYQGDTVETGADAAVGITFLDDSAFSLGGTGRMVLDEYVYDPASGSGESSVSLLSGVFSFVSGEIAKNGPDAMTVDTPVATIGIRGTRGVIQIELPEGFDPQTLDQLRQQADGPGLTMEVVLLPEPGGVVGEIVFTSLDGQVQTINIPFQGVRLQVANINAPSAPAVQRIQVDESYGRGQGEVGRSLNMLPEGSGNGDTGPRNGPGDPPPPAEGPGGDAPPPPDQQGANPPPENTRAVVTNMNIYQQAQNQVLVVTFEINRGHGKDDLDGGHRLDVLGLGLQNENNGEIQGPGDRNRPVDVIFEVRPPPAPTHEEEPRREVRQEPVTERGDRDPDPNSTPTPSPNAGTLVGEGTLVGDGTPGDGGTFGSDGTLGGGGTLGNTGSETGGGVLFDADGRQVVAPIGGRYSNVASTIALRVEGSTAGDTIETGSGNDLVIGGDGDDTIQTNNGNDTVIGGGGADTVIAGSGQGNDTYYGGLGPAGGYFDDSANDTIRYPSAVNGVTVDLQAGTASGLDIDSDRLRGFEHVEGGAGADTISGDGNANRLVGGAGNDILDGRGGVDTLIGGAGDDTLIWRGDGDTYQGGAGTDTLAVLAGRSLDLGTIWQGGNSGSLEGIALGSGANSLALGTPASWTSVFGSTLTVTGGTDDTVSGTGWAYQGKSASGAYWLFGQGGVTVQVSTGVRLSGLNVAPTLTVGSTTLTYVEGGSPISFLPSLGVTNEDGDMLVGASVTISSGRINGDDLLFTAQSGITGRYDAALGVLTLSGSASASAYQTALRSVTYRSTADLTGTSSRTFSVTVTDSGQATSLAAHRVLAVSAAAETPQANQAPEVQVSGGHAVYIHGGSAVKVAPSLHLSDSDSAVLTGARVVFGSYDMQADMIDHGSVAGVSADLNSLTGVLTFSGTASVADYQALLRSVTFASSNPGDTGSRSVSITVTDDHGNVSAVAARTVDLENNFIAPTLTHEGGGIGLMFNGGTEGIREDLVIDPLRGGRAFTVEAWISPQTLSKAMTILQITSDGSDGIHIYLDSTGALRCSVYGDSEYLDAGGLEGASDFTVNEDTHIALVNVPGDKLYCYIGGVLVTQVATGGTGAIFMGPPTVWIGTNTEVNSGNPSPMAGGWEGALDDIRFWSTARTASEIAQNYHDAVSPDSRGLSLYYTLDQGGTTVAELAAFGNEGSATSSMSTVGTDGPAVGTVEGGSTWASLRGLSISDSDAGSGTYTISFASDLGTFSGGAYTGVGYAGQNTGSLVASGALSALSAMLAANQVSFLPADYVNGLVDLLITVTDEDGETDDLTLTIPVASVGDTNVTWTGGTSGQFTDGTNWSTNVPPNHDDIITVNATGTQITVDTDVALHWFDMVDGGLNITSAGTLRTFAQSGTSSGSMTINGGTWEAALGGSVNFTGSLDVRSGDLTFNGGTLVLGETGSSIAPTYAAFSSGGEKRLNQTTVEVYGRLGVAGTVVLDNHSALIIGNESLLVGTLAIDGTTTFSTHDAEVESGSDAIIIKGKAIVGAALTLMYPMVIKAEASGLNTMIVQSGAMMSIVGPQGTLTNDGDLTLAGTGTRLALSSAQLTNQAGGTLDVGAATVELNGTGPTLHNLDLGVISLGGGDVRIGALGAFLNEGSITGYGTIDATQGEFTNKGYIMPDNGSGGGATITVDGRLTLTETSRLIIDGYASDSDFVRAGGPMVLDGTLEMRPDTGLEWSNSGSVAYSDVIRWMSDTGQFDAFAGLLMEAADRALRPVVGGSGLSFVGVSNGGAGDDDLSVGLASTDTLAVGTDQVAFGQDGNDLIEAFSLDFGFVDGGAGVDTLSYDASGPVDLTTALDWWRVQSIEGIIVDGLNTGEKVTLNAEVVRGLIGSAGNGDIIAVGGGEGAQLILKVKGGSFETSGWDYVSTETKNFAFDDHGGDPGSQSYTVYAATDDSNVRVWVHQE